WAGDARRARLGGRAVAAHAGDRARRRHRDRSALVDGPGHQHVADDQLVAAAGSHLAHALRERREQLAAHDVRAGRERAVGLAAVARRRVAVVALLDAILDDVVAAGGRLAVVGAAVGRDGVAVVAPLTGVLRAVAAGPLGFGGTCGRAAVAGG